MPNSLNLTLILLKPLINILNVLNNVAMLFVYVLNITIVFFVNDVINFMSHVALQNNHLPIISPFIKVFDINGFLNIDWPSQLLDVEPQAKPPHNLEKVRKIFFKIHPMFLPHEMCCVAVLSFVNHLRPSVVSAFESS